jgi:hypothetical protein
MEDFLIQIVKSRQAILNHDLDLLARDDKIVGTGVSESEVIKQKIVVERDRIDLAEAQMNLFFHQNNQGMMYSGKESS